VFENLGLGLERVCDEGTNGSSTSYKAAQQLRLEIASVGRDNNVSKCWIFVMMEEYL
jgi:hypothetical protein